MNHKGPGLLLRDILTGKDKQVEAAAEVIAAAAPDVILLTGFDYDLEGVALAAFADRIRERGLDLPNQFAARPNTGRATGLDLDGDGRLGGPGDAQGYGRFSGEGGMAVLSRRPLGEVADYSAFLWRDLPDNLMAGAGLSDEASEIQRLSTTGHWAVPVELPGGGQLTLLAWMATPPVFDGPEDRNGRRNHDEAAFWVRLLDGELPFDPPKGPFVVIGDANLDTHDGDGRPEALEALIADPRMTDPWPEGPGGAAAAAQGGDNLRHKGPPALDTADWRDEPGPGNLRVDYVLPSSDLSVMDSKVWWPEPGSAMAEAATAASRHRLVMVEVELP